MDTGKGDGATRLDPQRNTRATKPIWWLEPRWACIPSLRAELRESSALRSWLRTLLIGACATLIVYAGFRFAAAGPLAVPAWAVLTPALLLPGHMLLYVGFLFAFPPIIEVQRAGIMITRGNVSSRILRDRILSVQIDATQPLRCRPIVRYKRPTGERTRSLGIAPKVDLGALAALLGESRLVEA